MRVSNISSKATASIATNFHIELPGAGGRKVYSNSPGHMTNMVAMPVHGKNLLQLFFSGNSGPTALKFDM